MSQAISEIPGKREEQLLVEQLRRGDARAFGKIYDQYAPALMGVISRIVADPKKAEAALQETFLEAWSNIRSYDPSKTSFFPWLLRMARTSALAKQEKSGRAVNYVSEGNDGTNVIASEMTPASSAPALKAIDLVLLEGCSAAEAAARLGITVEALKLKIRNELKQLREITPR